MTKPAGAPGAPTLDALGYTVALAVLLGACAPVEATPVEWRLLGDAGVHDPATANAPRHDRVRPHDGTPLTDERRAASEPLAARIDARERAVEVGLAPRDERAHDAAHITERPNPEMPCRVTVPEACERCGDYPCRQVRVSPLTTPEDTRWTPFCAAGDVFEAALIACICGGGNLCHRAATDTVVTLEILRERFGGTVPPVGTRFRDVYGLAAVVDSDMHAYLRAVAGPEREIRCSFPDPEALEDAYDVLAQRVRLSGRCDVEL